MVDAQHASLSIRRQCELLGLNRSSWYYQGSEVNQEDLRLMRLLDEQYLRTPAFGSRMMSQSLSRQIGYAVSNRFAGPMVRVRWTLQRIAEGEDVKPLSFREGDFWQEFSDDFNAAMLKQREGQLSATVELTDNDQTEVDRSNQPTLQKTS